MSDERLPREHTAWLGAVLRGHARREDVESDEPRAATPDEVAAAVGRRERELTRADAAALRRTHQDEESDEAPEETSDFAGFLADLRRQRRKTPPPTSEREDT